MRIITALVLGFFLALSPVSPAMAELGVGVSLGKIDVDEVLSPGGIYNLPPITVFNTGDERADYVMSVQFMEYQEERRPEANWIKFSPQEFSLEAGQSQVVEANLDLPVKAAPGEYFAFLEAGPVQKQEGGTATIGIAAATKLKFEVRPANWWTGLAYKIAALWKKYSPWTYIVSGILALVLAAKLFGKYFGIRSHRQKFHQK